MTPGTVVEVVDGIWRDRVGEVEAMDPEWAGVADGMIVVRLYAVGRGPQVERAVLPADYVRAVDLRGRG